MQADINIGGLRHKVKVMNRVNNIDAAGGQYESYVSLGDRHASIDPISGREYFTGQQTAQEANYKIRMRYLAGITPSTRLVYGARVFDVLHIANISEQNRVLMLMCKEVFNGG